MKRAALALLTVLLTGRGWAQTAHDHHHEAPPTDDPGTIADQLTRTTSVHLGDADVQVSALWATPAYYAMESTPEQAALWRPRDSIVMRVDETTHTDYLPAATATAGATLVIDGAPLSPTEQVVDTSVEHHRITTLRFDLSPYRSSIVTLRLSDGQELTWDAGRWFGLSPDERIIEVSADANGFEPKLIEAQAGQPLVFLFKNESTLEHHFHIMELEPVDLRWFMLANHDMATFDLAVLDTAERTTGHVCDSETGLCRLGTNVHLHANPRQFDAVGFIAPKPGRYVIVCPLHESMRAELVVR